MWAVVRDRQIKGSFAETGYPPVNICDCGDADDIHPPEKRVPALRASAFYRALASGETPPAGAVLKSSRHVAGEKRLVLEFEMYGSRFTPGTRPGSVAGVTEEGKVLALPSCVISGSEVEVRLPEEKIVTVAMGWCENPVNIGLFSENGLPAFPFRFDATPLMQ